MPTHSRSLARLAATLVVFVVALASARAAEPPKYPESPEGIEKLANDMVAAVKAGNKDKAAELAKSMVLPNHEAWFVKTFGEAKGKELAEAYGKQAATLDKDMVGLIDEQLQKNRTDVKAYKLESADDRNATGAQSAAITAMKDKVPLYGFRLVEPGKTSGMHVWSFVYLDGAFRYAGKMSGGR